jgi:hypothetical protein
MQTRRLPACPQELAQQEIEIAAHAVERGRHHQGADIAVASVEHGHGDGGGILQHFAKTGAIALR